MQKGLQEKLFNHVVQLYPRKSDAVDELSDILSVGKDAIYRRLRGDTLLTPEEIELLANRFKISLDGLLLDASDKVFFTFNPFTRTIRSFDDYLDGVFDTISRISRIPEVDVMYASSEIPIFYYCFFPELISFKLYIWGRTVWDLEFLHHRKFDFNMLPRPALEKTEKLVGIYKNLKSTELWNLNILDNTLNQIEYHAVSGGFANPEDALRLCDMVESLAGHIKLMAETGKKFSLNGNPDDANTAFHLYHNEMIYTNNTILAVTPNFKVLFATHGSPNYLSSNDPKICDYFHALFLKIIAKCNSISGHDERGREWFFNRLHDKITNTRKRVSLYVEEA